MNPTRTIPHSRLEAADALPKLRSFIGKSQLFCLEQGTRGEESQYFLDLICQLAERIIAMPGVYEQDGKGDEAIVYLHYFRGGMDWFITEKDIEDDDEPGQHQAFGLSDLGHGGELGYICIRELIECHVELDFYFEPRTLGAVQAERKEAA